MPADAARLPARRPEGLRDADLDRVFVGLDLGTSSLKGVALSPEGTIVARASARYPTRRPRPGWAEQDPANWIKAMRSVVAQLGAQVPGARWAGIGLAGMIPTFVGVDAAGRSTGPAITWEDARADEQGRRLRQGGATSDVYAVTGQWVDGRYLLPMYAWLGEHEPARAASTRKVLGAKDYLFWWLTGRYATDPSTATGFGCFDPGTGHWHVELARAGGIRDLEMLPEVCDSATAVTLEPRAAEALGLPPGIPVILGGADSVLGLLGMDATKAGDAVYIWGSSSVIVAVSAEPVRDPQHRFLVSPLAGSPGWGLELDLVSTGTAVGWLAANLNLALPPSREPDALLALAAKAPIGANGLSFLPFVGVGEQGARWDPTLRGTVLGLSLANGPTDIARALVEGIMLESRRCLDVLDHADVLRGSIKVTAGPGSGAIVARLLAEATGRDVSWSPDEPPYSAVGAALMAAIATGVSLQAAFRSEHVTAEVGAAQAWATLAARHEALVQWAQEVYATLVP